MLNVLTSLLAVTVVLGVMILVHEWGHFVAAKLSGVRVVVFSFGLGPRLFGVKRGDTDYRLSALPFGGYVRMAGDNPVEERSGAPDEFLSKPRWQRVLIAIAGPTMNILLTLLIFWGVFWLVGIPYPAYLRQPAEVVAVPENSTAGGVLPGDRIVQVNGVPTATWEQVFTEASKATPGAQFHLVVERGGAAHDLTIQMPGRSADLNVLGYAAVPPVTDEVVPGLPAQKAGMRGGDLILSINGQPIVTWPQLVERVHQSGGHPIQFVVRRNGQDLSLDIKPIQGPGANGQTVWQIGVLPLAGDFYERQGFVRSAKQSVIATAAGIRQIVEVLAGLVSGRVSMRELQGVVGIARESGEAAKHGPMRLIELMAIISLNLGILNLLPIPILDGGHVLLLAIEGVLRRDLSIAVKERFVQVGLVFLLAVFAFVMYYDVLRLLPNH